MSSFSSQNSNSETNNNMKVSFRILLPKYKENNGRQMTMTHLFPKEERHGLPIHVSYVLHNFFLLFPFVFFF
jgi:hypothetical protein